jgi:hypothetical protein
MGEPIVEIVYSLSEEDILQHVRLTLKSRFKDPMFRCKVAYFLGFGLAGVGLISLTYLLVTGDWVINTLSAAGLWIGLGAVNGFRFRRRYLNFYKSVKNKAKKTDWLVFRADRSGFTITRPGISETSINWTTIKSVNLTKDYLYVNTVEETTYRVPSRYIREEQWNSLRHLLCEMWDQPGTLIPSGQHSPGGSS